MNVEFMHIAHLLLVPSVVSLLLMIPVVFSRLTASVKRPHTLLLLYLLATSLTWATFFQLYFFPEAFLFTHVVALLAFLMMPVLLYQLIHEATKLDVNDRFSGIHYFLPVLITLALLVLTLITPKEVQVAYFTSMGQDRQGGHEVYFWMAGSRMKMRLVFSLLYTALGFQRLYGYRRAVLNVSANDGTNRLSWVFWLLCVSVSLVLIPLLGNILSRKALFLSPWVYLQGGVLLVLNTYLTVYVIRWQEVVLLSETSCAACGVDLYTTVLGQKATADNPESGLSKQRVDQYMIEERPYLNPHLRIADLAAGLGVNRADLSTFINETYQKNFSCFINGYRFEAYQALVKRRENAILTKTALAEMAGFNSYRSLLRFQKLQLPT